MSSSSADFIISASCLCILCDIVGFDGYSLVFSFSMFLSLSRFILSIVFIGRNLTWLLKSSGIFVDFFFIRS